MSSIHIEYATAIYADRLREAEAQRLEKRALSVRQKQTRNPVRALGHFVRVMAKEMREHCVSAPAVLSNTGS